MGCTDTGVGNVIVKELKKAGFMAALIPISVLEKIKEIYNTYAESENAPFSTREWFFSKQPPDLPFEPQSFLVVAFQSPGGEIRLRYKGKDVLLPVPPAYLDESVKQRLRKILDSAADGFQLAEAKAISLKLLAVLSGLGKYGRNALCYSQEYGSFCNFDAYYTNIPCEEKAKPPSLMDQCANCGLCIDSCPNGALGGQLIIDVSRCLTLWNEHDGPMPDWLMPDIHHAAIGCMRCQEVCPANKTALKTKKDPLVLDEAETEALLSSPPADVPVDLTKKLLDYGLWEMFIPLAGRNIKLALHALEAKG